MMSAKTDKHGVGFVGLGNMGWWMAFNLRRCLSPNTELYVYDIDTSVTERLRRDAAENRGMGHIGVCLSPREVAINSDVVFTMVPEGRNVEEIFLTRDIGILSGPVDDKTFVDCSTIDPATSIEVGKAILRRSLTARFYDVPVSGGVLGAQAGTLTFLAGTSEDDAFFTDCLRPLLQIMGRHIFCVGGPGQGLVAKLCNNYLSGTCAIATSEAMNIGIRHGIEPRLLKEIFNKSTGANWQNANMNPVPGVCPNAVTSHGYQGGFKVQMMVKDFTLAMDTAKQVDAKLVLADAGLAAYKATSEDERCRNLDNRVVYRWLGGIE